VRTGRARREGLGFFRLESRETFRARETPAGA